MTRLNPVQKFAVLSGVCIASLCLALAFVISYVLERHMREAEWLSTAEIVRHDVREHDLDRYFTDPQHRREPAKFRQAFESLLRIPGIVRIKVWDREATVLWSDDKRLIGQRFPENPEVRQALAGRVSAALRTLRKSEHEYERRRFRHLAEIYAPISSQSSGEVVGVVEVYKLPTRLFAAIRTMRIAVWGIVTLGGIGLFLTLLPVVRRSYRRQLELEEALRQQAQDLERKVDERTRDLQALNRELDAASRHKSEFLANMSHELRTPLNAVIGFAEMLKMQGFGPLTPKQQRHVANIHTSGIHLLNLVNDILDLARVETGRLELRREQVALAPAVAQALEGVRPQAEKKGVALGAAADPALPPLHADPVRLQQILVNLLSNAMKFTPEGGRVTVRARAAGGWVDLAVADTGIGIATEDLPRLFRKFEQLDGSLGKAHPGAGLGLALTKHLVELHGGTIAVASPGRGQGTTFTVRLPAGPPRERPLVLVVEDDPALREHLAGAAAGWGWEARAVATLAEARETLQRVRPDLLVLDVSLPDGSGIALAREVRRGAAARPAILMYTGLGAEEGQAALEAGADDYLVKPAPLEALRRKAGRLLARAGWDTEQLQAKAMPAMA